MIVEANLQQVFQVNLSNIIHNVPEGKFESRETQWKMMNVKLYEYRQFLKAIFTLNIYASENSSIFFTPSVNSL